VLLGFFVAALDAVRPAEPCPAPRQHSETVLYNGIRLPADWPAGLKRWTREPVIPPYLYDPPDVIPIDVGRQLFVDDFLIEHTDLEQVFHKPVLFEGNPVLGPDREWEKLGRGETAMPFSDGVWYDPADKLFKMWYMAGYCEATALAVSRDGVHWDKPDWGIVPGTNIVLKQSRDACSVILDLYEADLARRFKMFTTQGETTPLEARLSSDGVHWSDVVARGDRGNGGRHTVFYNPFRKVWVFSLRDTWAVQPGGEPVDREVAYNDRVGAAAPVGRARRYREATDVLAGVAAPYAQSLRWVSADRLDTGGAQNPEEPPSQIYNLDCAPYESVVLGLFCIWRREQAGDFRKPKWNEIVMGYSRDGFHWHRPDRTPFIGISRSRDSWQTGNVQSVGGGCLVVGDKLYFYFSARSNLPEEVPTPKGQEFAATGLAVLRRDGFASMRGGDRFIGTLTTRTLTFSGKHLFVNVDNPEGELRILLLDPDNRTLATSEPISADSTCKAVRWKERYDLAEFAGKPVRLRFLLKGGDLYSFWVSDSPTGASHGYVAAGGPGFAGPVDSEGVEAHKAAEQIRAPASAPTSGESQ
jgi:hypothetical protein